MSITGNYHIASPRIRVTAIGAGGGSIASVDASGVLIVGPESAGAVPGPGLLRRRRHASDRYGCRRRARHHRSEVFPGRRDPARTATRAEDAIREHIAEPLGLSVLEAAAGIRAVAENQMADLVRTRDHSARLRSARLRRCSPTAARARRTATRSRHEAGIDTVVIPRPQRSIPASARCRRIASAASSSSDPQHTPPGKSDPADHLDLERINRTFDALEERCRSGDARPSATRS